MRSCNIYDRKFQHSNCNEVLIACSNVGCCACCAGMFSFYSQPKSHGATTIVEFIKEAMEHSRTGRFLYFLQPLVPGYPPAPIQLLYPVSRLRSVFTLQHMCRFLILKCVRKDHLAQLPLPRKILVYLQQSQYYAEYSDEVWYQAYSLYAVLGLLCSVMQFLQPQKFTIDMDIWKMYYRNLNCAEFSFTFYLRVLILSWLLS